MAARSTRAGGRTPEQAGHAAWLATEKVVRAVPRRPRASPRLGRLLAPRRFARVPGSVAPAPPSLAHRLPHPPPRRPSPPFPPLVSQNAELFTLTYGAIVRQVLHDYEDCVPEANAKLDAMGHSIGCRLVEDFLAKTDSGRGARCEAFRDAAETVAKVGLRMFLGIGAECERWNEAETRCAIVLESNPLARFAELPPRYRDLSYCQLLCGVIRGALEMIGMRTTCAFGKDALRGDDGFELDLELVEKIAEEYPFDD